MASENLPKADSPRDRRSRPRTIAVLLSAIVVVIGGVGAAVAFGLVPGLGAPDGPDDDSSALADIEQEPTSLWILPGLPNSTNVGVMTAGKNRAYRMTGSDAGLDVIENINTQSGTVVWRRDLSATGKESVSLAMDDEYRLVVASYDWNAEVLEVRSLDPSTGHDMSVRSWDGSLDDLELVRARGPVLLREGEMLYRVDPEDLHSAPIWQVSAEGAWTAEVLGEGRFLAIAADSGDIVVDSRTGEQPDWYGGAHLQHAVFRENIVRLESLADREVVEVMRADGTVRWTIEVDQFLLHEGVDGEALFFEMRRSSQPGSDTRERYEYAMRLSPDDGSPMWDRPVRIPFNAIRAGAEGKTLLIDQETDITTVIDPLTGNISGTLPSTGLLNGQSMYYQIQNGNVMRAWRGDGQPAWTRSGLGEGGHAVANLPGLLITHNSETGEMIRWG